MTSGGGCKTTPTWRTVLARGLGSKEVAERSFSCGSRCWGRCVKHGALVFGAGASFRRAADT
eukprot:10159917-Alexandrium_andersonii.AAC.1